MKVNVEVRLTVQARDPKKFSSCHEISLNNNHLIYKGIDFTRLFQYPLIERADFF